jgi:hypothetical protein
MAPGLPAGGGSRCRRACCPRRHTDQRSRWARSPSGRAARAATRWLTWLQVSGISSGGGGWRVCSARAATTSKAWTRMARVTQRTTCDRMSAPCRVAMSARHPARGQGGRPARLATSPIRAGTVAPRIKAATRIDVIDVLRTTCCGCAQTSPGLSGVPGQACGSSLQEPDDLFLRRRGIRARIARRGVESYVRLGRQRWKVERSLSWLNCFRRLQVRWDRDSGRWFAFVLLACAVVCCNRR